MVKDKNCFEKLDDAENILCRIDEKRKRYNTNKAIFDAIKSDPEKDYKTGQLFLQAIDQIIGRASTEQPAKIYNTISEMDAYYIPDDINLSDDDLCEILYGLLCRPQAMNFKKDSDGSKKRDLKYKGLAKLNYILEGAAKHTMRQMEKNATVHSKEYLKATSGEKKEVGFWKPEERSKSMKHVATDRYGLGYFKNQLKKRVQIKWSQKDKKYKVYFKISSLDDYLAFARSLLSSKKEIVDKRGNIIALQDKSFGRRQKDGLFLKNIIAFSDMEINDAYVGKRTHFIQNFREDICPFLEFDPSKIHIKELDDHEFEISGNFHLKDYNKDLKGRFVYCTKSQASMIDKTRRDINYSANKDLKDMIRGTIFMENHNDLVLMMHRRIKYFIQNSESNFYHSLFNKETHHGEDETNGFDPEHGILRGLSLKDKGILNTKISNRIKHINDLPVGTKPKNGKLIKDFTNNELNWAATQYLMNASKHEQRKSRTSKEYQDSKLIEPELIRSDQISQELKFQLDKAETEAEKGKTKKERKVKWQEDHRIRKLKQSFELLSRDEKHISKEKIIHEVKLLLRDQELKKQIEEDILEETRRGEEPENAENRLYRELILNLEQIKSEKTEKKSTEPTEFCDKEIRKNLVENDYQPDI